MTQQTNKERIINEAIRRHTKRYAETRELIIEIMAPITDAEFLNEADEDAVAKILATAQIIDAVMGTLVRDLASSALVRLAQIKLVEEASLNGKD